MVKARNSRHTQAGRHRERAADTHASGLCRKECNQLSVEFGLYEKPQIWRN